MPLYIVGIAIAIGFALLLWRQHKSGAGWQREVSFLVDLVALSATALVVGVLVVAQLRPSEEDAVALNPDEESTPIAISTKAVENEPVVATETVLIATSEPEPVVPTETVLIATSEIVATATSKPKPTATTVDEKAEATATPKASPTTKPNITATSTLIPKATIEPTPEVMTYTVRSGDVFALIAQNHNLSFDQLLDANPGVVPQGIKIGDKLMIPLGVEKDEENEAEDEANSEDETSTPVPDPSQYIVRAGDTFGMIAQRFGLTIEELSDYNPKIDPQRLSIGDTIYIP